MNFFEHQRQAKKKTSRLMLYFFLVVVLVALLTAGLVAFGISRSSVLAKYEVGKYFFFMLQDHRFLAAGSVCFLLVSCAILIRSWWETSALKSDPISICYALGASPASDKKSDLKIKQYINIVEEMSLASSVPVPEIFVLEDRAINAFACGYDINSAAICVTRGCLDKLNRDELQAVVAHEYSHILNGDMTINLKLVGMLAGLILIFHAGEMLARSRSRRSRDRGGVVALGVGLMAIGGVGYLGGLFLKAAISRQREFLADASSVQFTRNPDGIVGALKKISVSTEHGVVGSVEASRVSHMFFVNGIKSMFSLATHPDIFDRIKTVDSNFDVKKFKKIESIELIKKMHQPQPKEQQATTDTKQREPYKKLAEIMPLFIMYQQYHSHKKLIIDLIQNKESVIQELKMEQLEKVLEKISGELKQLSAADKRELQEEMLKEIKADGKINFKEFLIYAYLKPSLSPMAIKPQKLNRKDFEQKANLLLSFYFYLDEFDISDEQKKSIGQGFTWQLMDKKQLSYGQVLLAIEKLRFADIKQRELVILSMKKLAGMNQNVNQKERVIFSLVAQMLSVPGSVLD